VSKVGTIGGTGYIGVVPLRLLAVHEHVELLVVTSRELSGTPVAQHFPNLRGHVNLRFSPGGSSLIGQCDVVFFALPPNLLSPYNSRLNCTAPGWSQGHRAVGRLSAQRCVSLGETVWGQACLPRVDRTRRLRTARGQSGTVRRFNSSSGL